MQLCLVIGFDMVQSMCPVSQCVNPAVKVMNLHPMSPDCNIVEWKGPLGCHAPLINMTYTLQGLDKEDCNASVCFEDTMCQNYEAIFNRVRYDHPNIMLRVHGQSGYHEECTWHSECHAFHKNLEDNTNSSECK